MRARLALAVAPQTLVVARLRRSGTALRVAEVLECTLPPPAEAGWPGLEEALREAARELGARGARVDVALLGRLAHAKVIALPPVRRVEAGPLVARSARRHFALRDEPLVADGVRLPGPRRGPGPTLAACAPAAVLEAVAAACAGAGLRLGAVVAGPVAVATAARARCSVARRGRVAVLAGGTLVLLEEGVPVRVQAVSDPERRLVPLLAGAEEEGASPSVVVVCGTGEEADGVRGALRRDERFGPRLACVPELERLPAGGLAALGAALAAGAGPLLLPPALAAARARRVARRAIGMAAASGVLLLAAAGIHLHGVRRELAEVRARRAEIAPAVERARELRAGVEGVRARLESIAAVEREASSWTEEIAALAAALPDSAHLRTLAVDSGGMRLAGVARSAAEVVPALERHPRFHRVSLAAPVRFEPDGAGEGFEVLAPLAPETGEEAP